MITVTCWHRGDVVPADGEYLAVRNTGIYLLRFSAGEWLEDGFGVVPTPDWYTELQIDPATMPPEPLKET